MMKNNILLLLFKFFILLNSALILRPFCSVAADLSYEAAIDRLIENGSYIATKEGRDIFSHNADQRLIPASIWKIATATAALDTLGRDYFFKTEFFEDSDCNLYIRGHGDPALISEEINLIFQAIKQKGVSEINNIYLDSSRFETAQAAPGISRSL
ncbi:MAG: hypothetical protein GX846_09605, partial [Deltaproteobacteria bacterium]|nr:hypothetical protein [Deltaproteobacteria bacterium]